MTARAYHSELLDDPLLFAPPYQSRSTNPAGFRNWWRLMMAVTPLPSPYQFPTLPASAALDDAELRILRRYRNTCEELADSTLLNRPAGFTVRWAGPGSEHVIDADLPPKEALRGTAVLFRQLASPDRKERASYFAARRIVGRWAHAAEDSHRDRRLSEQKAWNRAQAKLRGGLLGPQADRVAARRMGHGELQGSFPGEEVRPEEILSMFQYGDLIHWGEHADALEALSTEPLFFTKHTHYFVQVVTQLSHFYLGYSILVSAALGEDTSRLA